jgi:hypothetical protein
MVSLKGTECLLHCPTDKVGKHTASSLKLRFNDSLFNAIIESEGQGWLDQWEILNPILLLLNKSWM